LTEVVDIVLVVGVVVDVVLVLIAGLVVVVIAVFVVCGVVDGAVVVFLRTTAMLKHVLAIPILSVRPSHAGIVSTRLNILS